MKQPADIIDSGAATPAPGSITLVRHGEPALSRAVRFDARGYGVWWGRYEEGGLKAGQSAPPRAAALAARADLVLVSTRRRALETAAILAPGRDLPQDALFIEAPLPPPPFPAWLKASPKVWGFVTRFWWWFFNHHAGGESRAQAAVRADAAAQRLIVHAQAGQDVMLVAHGFFNVMIEKALVTRGWTRTLHEGGYRYWSIRHFEKH